MAFAILGMGLLCGCPVSMTLPETIETDAGEVVELEDASMPVGRRLPTLAAPVELETDAGVASDEDAAVELETDAAVFVVPETDAGKDQTSYDIESPWVVTLTPDPQGVTSCEPGTVIPAWSETWNIVQANGYEVRRPGATLMTAVLEARNEFELVDQTVGKSSLFIELDANGWHGRGLVRIYELACDLTVDVSAERSE